MTSYKISALKLLFITFIINGSYGDDSINLYGEAGQAYALEINIGHPPQKLNVIVDTGSTTLAVASQHLESDEAYFHRKNSTTIFDTEQVVKARYSQGMWEGHLVSDFIRIPSLGSVREVRTDFAVITKSQKFFVNGSGWQGLLGLAYLPVGARGEYSSVVVESWLDSLDRTFNSQSSFELKLCGPTSHYNATHYGSFQMLDMETNSSKPKFKTPILQKRWYEVGVISIRLMSNNTEKSNVVAKQEVLNKDMCIKLNEEKSIVDSGTTNIRLPDVLYKQIVDELKNASKTSNVILDEFWFHGEEACWAQPQEWTLPWIAIDILSDNSDFEYFTLEIPPQNYMRVMSARNSSDISGAVPQYCYKLGLEAGGRETVLGYTAMEGFQVTFNRSAGWIGWAPSQCGPGTRISGPHHAQESLIKACQLTTLEPSSTDSLKVAQWTLCVISFVAVSVVIYLLTPCVKMFLIRKISSGYQISLSQTTLVEQE